MSSDISTSKRRQLKAMNSYSGLYSYFIQICNTFSECHKLPPDTSQLAIYSSYCYRVVSTVAVASPRVQSFIYSRFLFPISAARVQSSSSCGPFQDLDTPWQVVTDIVDQWNRQLVHYLSYITSPGFAVYVTLILWLVGIFFF